MVESNSTIKVFIGQDVLLTNELHNVFEGNSLFEILATIWNKLMFWTQNGMKCKLCRIIRRDLGVIVAEYLFLQKQKLFICGKVEHWILIVSRYWWETSPVVGYIRSWKKRIAVVGNDFQILIFRVTSCCFYMSLPMHTCCIWTTFPFFGRIYNSFHIWEFFPFLGTWCKF